MAAQQGRVSENPRFSGVKQVCVLFQVIERNRIREGGKEAPIIRDNYSVFEDFFEDFYFK